MRFIQKRDSLHLKTTPFVGLGGLSDRSPTEVSDKAFHIITSDFLIFLSDNIFAIRQTLNRNMISVCRTNFNILLKNLKIFNILIKKR